ncbi:MAG TPA: HDIG domain-containing protein, partial [Longimicrobium sp.]|nr:HDIG domain-containing protein [Longimicrobium sp.]
IISLAIQRIAADHTAETTVSVVALPSDEMKGRIIGREGRNIRAFEQATGIDVIIDDTPEAVVLSGFDPVRRETARIALEKLVSDGRIHPGRIEEVVGKARKEVENGMREAAEEILYELGIHGVHPEIVKVLGRLKFRTSYGQNQLLHAKEVAILAGNMASEMGFDATMAKRMGLLHDVGKGMTHDHEGTHVELGWNLSKKYGEPPQVLNAIKAHHDEEPHLYPESFLVTAADAISGSRPGARREMFETYVKRLEKLVGDGRIHPGRIDEVVAKARKDVETGMREAAEEAMYELGIHGVHPEIVKVLGRLKFRTSYGQSQLQHAKEVAILAGNMAAEMGFDATMAKRMGLLHDVGKGMTHEHEGTHVELGYQLCKKYNEPPQVLNAIKAHHDEEPHLFPESFLVTAGDAISGSRPGARREMFETYVKRLEKLEEIATSFPGVERCFAIQAGRELRVLVQPEQVSDEEMARLSEDTARRIEAELQYPGQIKVVVIRETRAVDFAR